MGCRNVYDAATFHTAHLSFAAKRHARLGQEVARRRNELLPLDLSGQNEEQRVENFATQVRDAALQLHARHHSVDPASGKRVSFGLVRMANIEPLVDVALALCHLGVPAGARVHLCTYHSQFPLLIRSAIEHRLDTALNRRDPGAVFALADIRQRLDGHAEVDQLFIVLGTSVTEVGRDHDYDWAIVEPSSMRSLIQIAGRIRRHRPGACSTANLCVFDTNLRHFRQPGEPAFCKPGFESRDFPLDSHSLAELLNATERDAIDARPRIVAAPTDQLKPRTRLVDLEHVRMRQTMLAQAAAAAPEAAPGRRQRGSAQLATPSLNATTWWSLPPTDALLTAVLPQYQAFRLDTTPRVELLLQPNDDGDDYALMRVMDKPRRSHGEMLLVEVERSQHQRIADEAARGTGIQPWGETDYLQALSQLAAELDLPLAICARRFGGVTVPENNDGWRFHPALGFSKRR